MFGPDPSRGVGRFIGRPEVEILPAPPMVSRVRVKNSDFGWVDQYAHAHMVSQGLVSDGASFPPLVRLKFGDSLSSAAADFGLPHDEFYRLGELIGIDKATADLFAYDMARCAGFSDADAFEIYEGLRLGGDAAWRENEAKRKVCGSDRQRLLAWV